MTQICHLHLFSFAQVPKAKPSCSARKYFADPDGWLNARVQTAIERAYTSDSSSSSSSFPPPNSNHLKLRVVVAPLVRFLCYSDAGGRLPAHVDLSRAVSLPPGCQLPSPPQAPSTSEVSESKSSPSSSSSSAVALNAGFVATRTGGLGDHGGGRQTVVKSPPRSSNPSSKQPKESSNGDKPSSSPTPPTSASTTHSFLLYLTNCPRGGTTDLLEALEGDAELAPRGGVVPGQRAVLAATQPMKGRLMIMPHACPHQASPVIDAPKLLIRGEALVFWETATTEKEGV